MSRGWQWKRGDSALMRKPPIQTRGRPVRCGRAVKSSCRGLGPAKTRDPPAATSTAPAPAHSPWTRNNHASTLPTLSRNTTDTWPNWCRRCVPGRAPGGWERRLGPAEELRVPASSQSAAASGVLELSHDEMYRHTTFPSTGTRLLVPSARLSVTDTACAGSRVRHKLQQRNSTGIDRCAGRVARSHPTLRSP